MRAAVVKARSGLCDGGEICFEDRDDDGYRTDTTVVSANVNCGSSREAAATDPDGDCDDTNATIHPGATETVGDEVDQARPEA